MRRDRRRGHIAKDDRSSVRAAGEAAGVNASAAPVEQQLVRDAGVAYECVEIAVAVHIAKDDRSSGRAAAVAARRRERAVAP